MVRLTDEQCDALKAEADAAGVKFFDHCRAKLLANMTMPARPPLQRKPVEARPAEDDRIGRLEAMMAQMGEVLDRLAHPVAAARQDAAEINVDDVVGGVLAQLQPDEPLDRGYPDRSGDGVRHLGTRKPLPLTGGLPRHLAG
jgi:hypothetical protein